MFNILSSILKYMGTNIIIKQTQLVKYVNTKKKITIKNTYLQIKKKIRS